MNEELFIQKSEKYIKNGFRLSKIKVQNKEEFKLIIEYKRGKDSHLIELERITKSFIDSIKKIWKNQNIILEKLDNAKVMISGWTFTDIKIMSLEQELKNQRLRKKIIFEINPNSSEENNKFRLIDYREPLELYIDNKLIFVGYIAFIHLSLPNREYSTHCEDFLGLFNMIRKETHLSKEERNSLDILKFYCDILDFKYGRDYFKGYHNEIRDYFILVPVVGLNINQEIKLGKCCLSHKLPNISLLKENPNYNKFTNFLCLRLKNNSFSNAFKQGMNSIQNSINLINIRGKIPTLLEDYDYFVQNSIIKTGDVIYLKDEKYGQEFILNIPVSKSPNLEIRTLVNYFFRPIFGIGEHYINPDRELTNDEKKIMWMLYYLNSAETKVNENRIAAFLDLWIANDFMLSVFCPKFEKYFKLNERRQIRKYCEQYTEVKNKELSELLERGKISNERLKDKKKRYKEMQDRVLQLIEKLNEPSHNLMLEKTLKEYNIPLSTKEQDLYLKARKKRNDIIHGEKIPHISRKEYNIVSKIIYFIIKKELFKTKVIEKRGDIRFHNPFIPIMVRIFTDHIIIGLEKLFPNNSNLIDIKRSINKLSELGMPKNLTQATNPDLRIPYEFDLILEDLIKFLSEKYPKNENIISAKKYTEGPYNVEDSHYVIRSVLTNIFRCLKELHSNNEDFQNAETIFNQFDRLGFHSLNVLQAMKGFERHKRRENIEKDERYEN